MDAQLEKASQVQPDTDLELAEQAKELPGGTDSEAGPPVEEEELLAGWRQHNDVPSLPEVNSSVRVPGPDAPWRQQMWAFAGVGFIISVGYMDPGNWATDISGGSAFGYVLLNTVLLASLISIFFQALSLKLGVATSRDLAQACRDAYPVWLNYLLWFVAEVAIIATDLAEIVGSATALYLLFNIPLWAGVLITIVDVLFILIFGTRNFRFLELVIFMLCSLIFGCFVYEMARVHPDWARVMQGFLPRARLVTEQDVLFNAVGILGATVMPHNLFLHSSIIQTRAYPRTLAGKRMAIHFGSIDSAISLCIAFFINCAILILAAAVFHYGPNANTAVAYISDAYHLLEGAVGDKSAKILFGVALLASGQNSTITGTLAGQIVMEGFLRIKLRPWVRRLLTRAIAIIPAAIVAGVGGNRGAGKLLVISQVVLSLALPFALAPLVHFTSSRARMGRFTNHVVTTVAGWLLVVVIAGFNAYLIVQTIRNNEFGNTSSV